MADSCKIHEDALIEISTQLNNVADIVSKIDDSLRGDEKVPGVFGRLRIAEDAIKRQKEEKKKRPNLIKDNIRFVITLILAIIVIIQFYNQGAKNDNQHQQNRPEKKTTRISDIHE